MATAEDSDEGADSDAPAVSEIDSFLREAARSPDVLPPRNDTNPISQRLGRYEIVAILGKGGMGVVYRAEDRSLRRTVALKVLPADRVGDPERRQRFLREARAAAAVSHPNIATVLDVGEVGEHLFLAMELCEGSSVRVRLSEAVASGKPGLPWREVVRIGLDVARALGKAHAARIVHRDIKPENLVLSAEGQVKVLDFGIAKFQTREELPPEIADTACALSTEDGAVLGTPGYMAPEQARGEAVAASADVFSLGVTLFELASGRRPYQGRGLDAVIAVERDDAPLLTTLAPDTPDALEKVIARCLARAPEQRFADGAALAAALTAVSEAPNPVDGPTLAGPPHIRLPRGRSLLLLALALLPLAALAYMALSRPSQPVSSATPASSSPEPNPLLAPGSVLACPPLDASGLDDPLGWLGAAAAHHVCQRSLVMLGQDPARVRLPEQLIAPAVPGAFGGAQATKQARDHALAQARAESAAWLDGSVEIVSSEFRVALSLLSKDGRVLGTSKQSGATLSEAVQRATDTLFDGGAIPTAESVAASPSLADALRLFDLDVARGQFDTTGCTFVESSRDRLGSERSSRELAQCQLTYQRRQHSAEASPSEASAAADQAVWPTSPHLAAGWLSLRATSEAERRLHAERALVLAPLAPPVATSLGDILLDSGGREEARALSASLSAAADPLSKRTGIVLGLRVDAGEVSFKKTFESTLSMIVARETLDCDADARLLELARDLSRMLGREHELGQAFAQRFVLGAAPRLDPTAAFALLPAASSCALAPRKTARACQAKLRALVDGGYFRARFSPATEQALRGFEALADGDRKAATAAWRPLTSASSETLHEIASAASPLFDAVAEPEVAERIEELTRASRGLYGGVDLATLYAARRALQRRDQAVAQKLASRIVGAWGSADTELAAVTEMRAVLNGDAAKR